MNKKKYYIDSLIYKEFDNNNRLIGFYQQEINKFVKGSLFIKKINNNKYCYIKYRDGKKTILKYIGKDNKIEEIKSQIEKRKHYEQMIKKLKEENEHILRMVNTK